MSSNILIARHGETDWNRNGRWQGHADTPLNSEGLKQAEMLAEKVSGKGITRIYSSDLSRARITAEIVGRYVGITEVTMDKRLRERNLGSLEGLSSAEISGIIGVPASHLDIRKIGKAGSIESWAEFSGRVMEAISDIREKNQGDNVLIVAHGGVMMATSMSILGEDRGFRKFSNGELLTLSFTKDWSVGFEDDITV